MKRIRRTHVLSMILVLAAMALSQAAAALEPGDFASSLARAVREDKPLVIDFYTDW